MAADTATNGSKMDLESACKVAIRALAPAAAAGKKTKLAEQYEAEWLAEIERRRVDEEERQKKERARKRREAEERERKREEARQRKLQRDREYRARKRAERVAQARVESVAEWFAGMRDEGAKPNDTDREYARSVLAVADGVAS